MTSKTSYFEPALFLRGLKKAFPVWLAYVVLWILFLPLSILNQTQWNPDTSDIRELILSARICSAALPSRSARTCSSRSSPTAQAR